MKNLIDQIKQQYSRDLVTVSDRQALDAIRVKYLGRKSPLRKAFIALSQLPLEQKRVYGPKLNELKLEISQALSQKNTEFKTKRINADFSAIASQPLFARRGTFHPITQIVAIIEDAMARIGFESVIGPEIETDYYNFEALNMGKDHPARDEQDTFYLSGGKILRTQTSAVQIRVMERRQPPLYIISAGKTYRRDDDITHTPMFHQVEGLAVDRNITLGHLKWTIEYLVSKLFGRQVTSRLRTSYFPYTEPSLEVDIKCQACQGAGCRLCKNSGWLEIMGAGLVHPQVLLNVGINPSKYSGFAFGLGVERIAMLKFEIPDIRYFYQQSQQFLEQFK